MRITLNISGAIDISSQEVIDLFREQERIEKEKWDRNHPAPPAAQAEPVKEESWTGKNATLKSYSLEELKKIGYDVEMFNGIHIVLQETKDSIELDADKGCFHPKSYFEIVKPEEKIES